MQRFTSILAVLTEDSLAEAAFLRALDLARSNAAALTLVDVIDAAPGDLGKLVAMLSGQRGAELEESVMTHHRDRLAAFAERARAQGVAVTEAVLRGTPFVEVIRMVLREGHDIVMKGATLASDGTGRFKGCDMHLLRKCPCPVWIVATPGADRFKTVLAAIDGAGDDDPTRAGLDRWVLDLSLATALQEGAELRVVHAWFLPAERALRQGRLSARDTVAGAKVDALVAGEHAAAQARVAARLADYPQVAKSAVTLRRGLPGDVIAEQAAAIGADVVVMGTVGRTGVSGLVMGNTAETALARVRSSVIAIKPHGFVSPVTLEAGG
jgi:nucleotide-binding universal stress UspA family protein